MLDRRKILKYVFKKELNIMFTSLLLKLISHFFSLSYQYFIFVYFSNSFSLVTLYLKVTGTNCSL